MATIINASLSAGLVTTADTSGILNLQSNGTTVAQVSPTGVAVTGTLSASGVFTPSTMGGSVITSGTAVASTSGTSIDFTGIPSWVKRITIMFDVVSTNGASLLQIQIGDSGGIETTGYSGYYAFVSAATVVGASSTTGFQINSNAASNNLSGNITLCNLSSNTWTASLMVSAPVAATANIGGGSKTLSATLDRVRITTVNGTDTFDAGSINIMYE